MHAILVASDLSIRSDRAVERALRIAGNLNLPCHVLCVIDDDQPGDIVEKHKANVEERLQRFVKSEAAPGQIVMTEVIAGDALPAILRRAEALDTGLLVLGVHRIRPFLDLLRETTMERLVRGALRPVLLVHDPADHDYEKVLAPVGFTAACALGLKMARLIAPDAEIDAFHAVLTPFSGLTGEDASGRMAQAVRAEAEALRDQWVAAFDLEKVGAKTRVVSGSVTEVLSRMSIDQPHLLAIGAHLRSDYNPYVLGGFAAELIRHPKCDLLVSIARPTDIASPAIGET